MSGHFLVALLAQTTTTTTEVPRVVGDPLPEWISWTAGLALLAAVLLGGYLAGRHAKRQL